MRNPRDLDGKTDKIVAITLDPNTITSIDPDEVHEWRIAIYDLVEQNSFAPLADPDGGPYALRLSLADQRLVLALRREGGDAVVTHILSLTPFRRIVTDYFLICASY